MLQFEDQELKGLQEASLIHLIGDVSQIVKSAVFEISLRCCIRRLRDASEMHPSWLGLNNKTKSNSFIP